MPAVSRFVAVTTLTAPPSPDRMAKKKGDMVPSDRKLVVLVVTVYSFA